MIDMSRIGDTMYRDGYRDGYEDGREDGYKEGYAYGREDEKSESFEAKVLAFYESKGASEHEGN